MQNQQPSGVTIVNGAPSVHAADHSRKQSVTISSAGTTGFIPNGGPAGNPNRNSIQFGSVDQQNSPAMGSPAIPVSQPHGNLNVAQPVNPRITSPSTSPSPIPQPASSGGRPPSTYQAPGNAPNFGSFGDASGDAVCFSPFSHFLFCSLFYMFSTRHVALWSCANRKLSDSE
jgi:translation initiation factor 4G